MRNASAQIFGFVRSTFELTITQRIDFKESQRSFVRVKAITIHRIPTAQIFRSGN